MNWMQGHALGREFKALVCHDGVFSMANQMSSDEQYFPSHDLGGTYYQAMEAWQKWDPSRFVGQWKTPMLVSVILNLSPLPGCEESHGTKQFQISIMFSQVGAFQFEGPLLSSQFYVGDPQ